MLVGRPFGSKVAETVGGWGCDGRDEIASWAITPLLVVRVLGVPALVVAASVVTAFRAEAQTEPAALVRALERAVDRGQADSARVSWRRAVVRGPLDPAARFALATLDRLEFRRDQAKSGLVALARSPRSADVAWRAAAQFSLGRLLVGTGDSSGAALLRAAMATADSAGAGAASTAAAAMLELARVVGRRGAADSARRLIERARATVLPADSSLTALAICSAGGVVAANQPRADSLIAEGTALAEAIGDRRVLARCHTTAYQAAMGRGLAMKSVAPLVAAYRAITLTRDAEAAATINQLRAFVYIQFSYGLANGRKYATQAIQLARSSGNRLAEGYAHLNLAQLAIRVGDFRAAAHRRDSAVTLFRAIGDRSGQAAAEFVAGDAASAVGDLSAAGRAYRAARLLYSELRSPIAGVNHRLALVAIETQDFAEAHRLLAEAGAEATQTGNRGFLSDKQYYDGLLALRDGRFLEAAELFRRYRRALRPGALQYYLDSGTREAEALALAGRLDEAETTLDSALAAIERVRNELSDREDGVNRDLLLAMASNRRFEFDPDLGLATIVAIFARAGRVDAAFRFAEAERARLLWVRIARRAMLRDSANTRPARVLVPDDLPLADLTKALGDHSALMAFSTGAGGEPTTVFVLDRLGLRSFPAPPGDSLIAPIQRFATLAAAGTWGRLLGRTLAAQLLDRPLASLDPGVRRLIVIPDGPLNRLPFDALPLADGTPLLTRYEVTLIPSARLAGEWLSRQPSGRAGRPIVVAFGDPRFDARFGLPRIRGSGVEARLATAGGKRGVSFLRAAASEAAFWRLDSTPAAVIHLATHARTEDAGALASAVFLAPGGGHDGRVGPEEIAGRHLPADLVMLTGCRTSGGALMFGEGVQGLVVPFLEAGARAVVATLWDVGDQRIVPLVRRVYQELELGAEAGAALRIARLASWRGGESPAIWAGITLTGDPRVRPLRAVDTKGTGR